MTTKYEKLANLVSHIRNAKYGEMVKYSEKLIDSGDWRDFKTPRGTRFVFRRCEYDYFLAAMEADATTLRHAYINTNDAAQLMRLADITGKGSHANGDRRDRAEVAKEYESEPSGAGARIKAWASESIVTDRTAAIAGDSRLRSDFEAGRIKRTPPKEKAQRWDVRWSDEGTSAPQAIADKLLKDPELAHEVWRLLRNELYNAKTGKRRSDAHSDTESAREMAGV